MSDISNQLIKDSYNYVLQSDISTGVVYRIGGSIPVNPIFQSGLTIQQSFNFSDGTEGFGYVLTSDALGNATWQPVSAATPTSGVTSITVGNGLSANTSTGAVFIEFTGSTGISGEYLPLSGGTVSGSTIFTNGLTANTISATTYYNLPTDVFVTGGTYSNGVTTFRNNTGGTFSVSGFSTGTTVSGLYLPLSGGSVYGPTSFSSGLTANTLNVTGLTTTSGLTSTGGITFPQVTINNSYTAKTSDYMIDIIGGTFNVQLPTAVGVQGKLLAIKNNGGGAVTILPFGSELIDDKSLLILSETNAVQLVSNGYQWIILGQDRSTVNNSTGVFQFSGITKVSSTQFYVAPVRGWIVDDTSNPLSPQIFYVNYSGGTHTDNYVTTAFETFVYLTSGGTISQSNSPLTEQQRRQNIFLGKIGHPEKTSINLVFSQPDFVLSPLSQLRDMFVPINLINGGVYPSVNGANLTFNTSAGYLYGLGINFSVSSLSPNTIYVPGNSPATFQYRTQTGGTVVNVTNIDPTRYDVGGVVTNITGTKATNQRIFLLQNGTIRVQYGQTTYTSLSNAIQALQTETFTLFPNFTNNAILIGILSVLSTCTDLSDTTRAQFFLTSKFGETIGAAGGIGTTTLQQAYNNSSTPEIILNATLDGLSLQNGTGNPDNTTRVLEGVNAANSTTSYILADGGFSGSSFSGNSLHISGSSNPVIFKGLTANTSDSNVLSIDSNGNVHTYPISSISGGSSTSGAYLPLSGGTVTGGTIFTSGLSANTVSATTYYNLPIDIRVTGGTYNGGNITFTNNTGGTFNVTGITVTSGYSSNYYASFSNNSNLLLSGANTATVWTYDTTEISNGIEIQNNSQIRVNNTGVYEFGYSPQVEKTQGPDATITIWAAINGTPVARSSSTLKLVSNSVLTLPYVALIFQMNANDYLEFYFSSDSQYVQLTSLSGLTTPTRPNSPALIVDVKQIGNAVSNTLTGSYLPLSGGTVTGSTSFTNGLTANTISATTYFNLPTDIRVTGGTYSNGNATFTNNTGGTFSVTGFSTSATFTGGTVSGATNFTNGLTANTISATTYFNLPVTADTFVTGATYSNNTFTFRNNTGGTFNVLFNQMTGLTATTISATTYQNLPVTADTFVTGFTFTSSTNTLTIAQNQGRANLTTTITTTPLSGVMSAITFNIATTGSITASTISATTITPTTLRANTISATTYQNLPTDIRVTGGTKSGSNVTFTNNTGGTFTVSGFSDTFVTGGTKSGNNVTFTNNTGGTFTVSGFSDTFVTGGTYTDTTGILGFRNNTGGTFNVVGGFNYVTGGTYDGGTQSLSLYTNTGQTISIGGFPTQVGPAGADTEVQLNVGGSFGTNTYFAYYYNGINLLGAAYLGSIDSDVTNSALIAGESNLISTTSYNSGIFAGFDSEISNTSFNSAVLAGEKNVLTNGSVKSLILGGDNNTMGGGTNSLILGGSGNNITSPINVLLLGVNSLTSVSNDTTYVSNFNINISPTNNDSNTQILTRNSTSGNIEYKDITSFTDTYVTGATYANNTFTYTNNANNSFSVLFNTITGLTINGNLTVTSSTISPTLSGNTLLSRGTYGSVTMNASNNPGMLVLSGSGTVGGANYLDFIRIVNTAAGATNPNKTIRVNNTGGIEFLNSAYSATTLSLSDNGILYVGGGNTGTISNNDGVSNYLSFNNNNSQIYDDGNFHIHSRAANQAMWMNTNGGAMYLLTQSPTSTGTIGTGIGIATTTLIGYVTINTGKTYTTSASYGYLVNNATPTGRYPGGSQTLTISLYATNRIWAEEFDAFSDERMKDIQGEIELDDAIKLVNTLKPIKYTWKEGEDKELKTGYSAQQVSKAGFDHLISILPKDGLEETIDDDGFVSPKDTQFSMNYDQVTPYHGVVIKHLLEEINNLKEQIKELQNKIK